MPFDLDTQVSVSNFGTMVQLCEFQTHLSSDRWGGDKNKSAKESSRECVIMSCEISMGLDVADLWRICFHHVQRIGSLSFFFVFV